MNAKVLPRVVVAVLAVMVGLYPAYYFVVRGDTPGILQTKPAELVASGFYRGAFYSHILFGGVALLIGWMQFSKKLRARRLGLHRVIGKMYMVAVAISGAAGLVIALSASGGFVCTLGFGLLAVLWLFTDWQGYRTIRRLEIGKHRGWMVRNYALAFAAVTLRAYLPLTTQVLHLPFTPSYQVISWACWVPNLVVAEVLVRRRRGEYANLGRAAS
jgi:uncharacterized membrane protein